MARWITPDTRPDADKVQTTTIGAINYGSESKMFVFAFRDTDNNGNVTDTSFPAYNNLEELTPAEKDLYTTDHTNDPVYMFVSTNTTKINGTDEVILYWDTTKNGAATQVDTGLRIASNGQIVGRLDYRTPNKELLFKVRLTDPQSYTNGNIYRAYSRVVYNGDIYQLNKDIPLPFTAITDSPDPLSWSIVHTGYAPQADFDFEYRIFKIIINPLTSDKIEFETGANLGRLRVGEISGANRNIQIVASPTQTISLSVIDGVMPPGLNMNSDGVIWGRPTQVGTYAFTVLAEGSDGITKTQEFELEVVDGYQQTTCKIEAELALDIERRWYNMITSSAWQGVEFYRPSDPNFGLQTRPIIPIKDNLECEFSTGGSVVLNTDHVSNVAALKLQQNVIDIVELKIGNMRLATAMDKDGNPLYDIIYKEVISKNYSAAYDPNSTNYSTFGTPGFDKLKKTIVNTLGSFDDNLDPLNVYDALRFYTEAEYTPEGEVISSYIDILDTWMVNPNITTGLTPGYRLHIPVAYVQPGYGIQFFVNAIAADELSSMLLGELISLNTLSIERHLSSTKTSKKVLITRK